MACKNCWAADKLATFLHIRAARIKCKTLVLVQACKLDPKAALPLLGLAQMNLLQKENTNAVTLLENALQLSPGWNDALMVCFQRLNM